MHVAHARLEHLHSGVKSCGNVDFENGRAVHVGIGLDGTDEVEDAGGGVDERVNRARGAQKARKVLQGDAGCFLSEMARSSSRSGAVTPCSANWGATSHGSAAESGEPAANGLAGDDADHGQVFGLSCAGDHVLLPGLRILNLLFRQAQVDELEAILATWREFR
jgi:hypothetical protein